MNDGTSFSRNDDDDQFVRTESGAPFGSHTVGYSGGLSGTVTRIGVNFRAKHGPTGRGFAEIRLYDGDDLFAVSQDFELTENWKNYTTSFDGLLIPSVSHLRSQINLTNTSGHGSLRYTQIWLDVTISR